MTANQSENAKRVRHKRRGTEYTVIGTGRIQIGKPLNDMDHVVIYWGDFGDLWVRGEDEFLDGRFEELPKPINRISLEDVEMMRALANEPRNALDAYQQVATHSAIYPGQGTPLGLVYVALKMNGEAGELAEHVGKAMRDDGLVSTIFRSGNDTEVTFNGLSPKRRALLIKEIGDVLWYLSAACNELGISLSHAAETNIGKLYDRGQRNALSGSGDER
ncbi:nucleoside triphosphate pyrophosphohydrolase family protein [Rhizobium daejeonense]|nr:nucleoside triphosphate pyrophosphohydrolase family protein [Rhizobium daejeonense]